VADIVGKEAWLKRKRRIRRKISGSSDRPRVSVFRSRRNFSAQAIDDSCGATLASISTESLRVKKDLKIEGNVLVENAKALGVQFAKILQEKGISMIVFDRNGYAFMVWSRPSPRVRAKAGFSFNEAGQYAR